MEDHEKSIDVSICIITYNHEKYIADCIMSVVSQIGNFSMEILVGVDNSKDRTLEYVDNICKKFPNLIKYYHHKKRLGYGSKNTQFLLKKAKGKYIAHLDGDDYWLPGKLNSQISILNNNPNFLACYTNAFVENTRNEIIGLFNNYYHSEIPLEVLLMKGNFLHYSSLVFRRELLSDIINIKSPFLDYKVNLFIARSGKVYSINKPMLVYRLGTDSSVLLNANDYVREKYWDALTSEISKGVPKKISLISLAEFLRSVFYHSIKKNGFLFFVMWYRRVLVFSSHNAICLTLLTLWAIFMVALKEVKQHIFGKRLKVLYKV